MMAANDRANRCSAALLAVVLCASFPGPLMAQSDNRARIAASGAIDAELEIADTADSASDGLVGVSCTPGAGGMQAMVHISTIPQGQGFGIKLQLRLPGEAPSGNYPLSSHGMKGSVRATLAVTHAGKRPMVLVRGGGLELRTLEPGYAGQFRIEAVLLSDGQQPLLLQGDFHASRVAGACP